MTASSCDALVVGAGGFLGGHLVRSLLLQGLTIRAVDRRPLAAWTVVHPDAVNVVTEVSTPSSALAACSGATTVYNLMPGPVGSHPTDRTAAVLRDTHLLLAARDTGADRFVVASTAVDTGTPRVGGGARRDGLAEAMARHVRDASGLQARVARLGPVYGPRAPHGAGAVVVTVVADAVAHAVTHHRDEVDIPFAAGDPAPGIYVDDAVLGLQLITHGADDPRPYDLVQLAPPTVGTVVTALVAACGRPLRVRFTGASPSPVVVGDPAPLRAAVDWAPDIAFTDVVDAVWAWALASARSTRDLPIDLTDQRARRRAPLAPRTSALGGGRHRYENAG